MRADADQVGNFDRAFKGSTKSFLFKGINGRWRGVPTTGKRRGYPHGIEELLTSEAAPGSKSIMSASDESLMNPDELA